MGFEIRRERKPKKLRAEQGEHFRLVQMGLTNKEASQRVGVHERTSREWQNGRIDPNRRWAPVLVEQGPVPTSSVRTSAST